MRLNSKFINTMAIFFALVLVIPLVIANVPTGPTVVSNTTEIVSPTPSTFINTSGGSFTTLLLNVTSQNYRWKAYVGDVTGKLTLDDSGNKSIYDWSLSTVTGNVYATRNSSIDWSSLTCAKRSTIYSEESSLGLTTSKEDSINSTFNNTVHKAFYAANSFIVNSTCPAIATYLNDAAQTPDESASFQEILLEDAQNRMVYTTVIESSLLGFDNNPYDFQMIVADDESTLSATPYYFYVELR